MEREANEDVVWLIGQSKGYGVDGCFDGRM